MKKNYYWDHTSKQISKIFNKNFDLNMSILSIGYSGMHLLEWMNDNGYSDLHGIEKTENLYLEIKNNFIGKNLDKIELIYGDILSHTEKYDAIFSANLLQCLNEKDRQLFFSHVSKLAKIAIFTVPDITVDNKVKSEADVHVHGLTEYCTDNLPYELSNYYNNVRVGRFDNTIIHLNDSMLYYICRNHV